MCEICFSDERLDKIILEEEVQGKINFVNPDFVKKITLERLLELLKVCNEK